jgi:hypothetical protein
MSMKSQGDVDGRVEIIACSRTTAPMHLPFNLQIQVEGRRRSAEESEGCDRMAWQRYHMGVANTLRSRIRSECPLLGGKHSRSLMKAEVQYGRREFTCCQS